MNRQVEEAAAAARAGKLIVFPTDTVYGLGTRPDDRGATSRLFDAKERARVLSLPILVPSVEAARRIAVFDLRAERLAEAYWPGALTMVLPRTGDSRPWDLGEERETIGVRMPRHPLALAVLEAAGPLAVTSANRSGEPPLATCDELLVAFGDAVAIYLCEEEPLAGTASTVVALRDGNLEVLRRGGLDPEALARVAEGA